MHPDYVWWGPMWFFPVIMPIIMLVALLLCLHFIFGRGGLRPPWHKTDGPYSDGGEMESALEILRKRYAKGEIPQDEFEQMRRDIQT